MSLLASARAKKEAFERLREKGLLSQDEIELLQVLGVLEKEGEVV